MSTQIQDSIEKEIVVRAPKERVYAALTDPEKFVKWFPDAIEGKLEKGERPVLDFGEYGKQALYIVDAQPFHYFAYRWASGSSAPEGGFFEDVLKEPNTLVEFRLEEVPEGTKVKLLETGFASLPSNLYEKAFADNSGGWNYMIGRLEEYLNQN